MSERELPREVAAALKALDQAESLAAEYAAIRGEDDEVAATKIRAVAMNLERWARASPTPPTTEGREERDAFEVWAHADHRRIEPEEYEERSPDNNHYYADDSTNQAYVGWCAALLSSPRVEDVRREALEEAAKVAERGCLVPPDGGSPTEAEREMCEAIAAAIRSLSPPSGDGKQEQATRASGPTAPTDLLQSKESYK